MGLGMVCGPLVAVMSSWRHEVPGGWMVVTTMTFGLGILIFTHCEGLSTTDAIYASIMTGTTIGFGDMTPNTDLGKVSVAIYALLVVGVVSGMLDTVRDHLIEFCIPPSSTSMSINNTTATATMTTRDDSWTQLLWSSSPSKKRSNGQRSNRKSARIQQQKSSLGQESKQRQKSSLASSSSTIRKRK